MFTRNVTLDMDTDTFVDNKTSGALPYKFKSSRGSLLFSMILSHIKTIREYGNRHHRLLFVVDVWSVL